MKYSSSCFISWVWPSAGNWAGLRQSLSHKGHPSHQHPIAVICHGDDNKHINTNKFKGFYQGRNNKFIR